MSPCPSDEQLDQHLLMELPKASEQALRAHLETCAACRTRLGRRVPSAPTLPKVPLPAPPIGEHNRTRRAIARARPMPEIPGYTLIKRIGGGGFGDVWLAQQRLTESFCALKVIFRAASTTFSPGAATNDLERDAEPDRIELEGLRRYETDRRVEHPNLVSILHADEQPDFFYYAMELADDARGFGVQAPADGYIAYSLTEHLSRQGPLPFAAASSILLELLSGLHCLHVCGLLHRDVKPANVIRRHGVWKLSDVGLVTRKRSILASASTKRYAPDGGVNDQSDDLYCVGVTLAEMLCGDTDPAMPRDSLFELAARRGGEDVRRLVERACANDRAARFQTCDQFISAIQRIDSLDGTQAAPGPAKPALRRTGVHQIIAPAAGLAVGVAVMLFGIIRLCTWQPQGDAPEPFRFSLPRATSAWSPVESPDRPMHHFVTLAGQFLPPGIVECALPSDTSFENFVLDFRIRSQRAWGSLGLELATEQDRGARVSAQFEGQPDGTGLTTRLTYDDGRERRTAGPIRGHPQPGIEYVVRVARERDGVALALWPLARAAAEPLVLRIATNTSAGDFRRVRIASGTDDVHGEIELLDGAVSSVTTPLARVDAPEFLPEEVAPRAVGAVTPGAVADSAWPSVLPGSDLLRDGFNPYESSAWTSLGYWAWWSGAAPEPSSRFKTVRCTPFSSGLRVSHRNASDYAGVQILRFDAGEYADFDASVRIRLAPQGDPEPYAPFVFESERGTVGIAFHLQADAPPGAAWGGGAWAGVSLSANRDSPPLASICRFAALILGRDRDVHFALTPLMTETSDSTASIAREDLLKPDGFVLHLRVRGRCSALYLNDKADPLVVHISAPAQVAPRGRIGLFTVRLIAEFDDFRVTPTPTTAARPLPPARAVKSAALRRDPEPDESAGGQLQNRGQAGD